MKIKARSSQDEVTLDVAQGPKLLDHLQAADVYVNTSCGGKGTCHKCRIQVKEGFLGITPADRKAFTEPELAEGWRLSCQATPRVNVAIQIPLTQNFRNKPRVQVLERAPESPRLACDLGSTGVVVAIGDRHGKLAVASHLLNRQVRFGDDVMSRLHSAQKQGVTVLQDAILDTLTLCLQALQKEVPALYAEAGGTPLFCAGNSAMTSFLNGWDITSLATSPYQPTQRGPGQFEWNGLSIRSLPLLAGFVGGDTFAGILAIERTRAAEGRPADEPWMMVDIGTNTEIVLSNGRGELWLTSAPAGPAFEGGNISSGMRAEPGAISVCRWRSSGHGGGWELETIGGDLPQGVCGSGLIDAIHEGVQAGLIAQDGFVPRGLMHLTDSIAITAGDVREFQLAKSATRTGCELIIDRAGVKPSRIYLAGTFAEHLRMDSVAGVGLLPPGIPAQAIGNASLTGTLLFAALSDEERQGAQESIESRRRPLELALQDDFQDAFVRNLGF
jgi:uncharacterized 2Fe-2S/4Fe-4S cluster protein (DUF4445 family)